MTTIALACKAVPRLLHAAVLLALGAGHARALPADQPAPVQSATLRDLARIVEQQQELLLAQGQRIDALEKRLSAAAVSPPPTRDAPQTTPAEASVQRFPELAVKDAAAEFPRAFPVPGTDAALRVGGQVRSTSIHSFDPIGSSDRFIASSIPVGTADPSDAGRADHTAAPSRLNFDLRTPTGVGHVRAFVEADFAGSGNVFRLRHAYGQWRQLLAGQTWSTFADPEADPAEIDFEGLNAATKLRQAQVRWTGSLGERVSLALALENPSPSITGATGVDQIPDGVVRLRFEPRVSQLRGRPFGSHFLGGGAHVQAAMIVRQIRGEASGTTDVFGATGFGGQLSGRLRVPASPDRDYISFGAIAGSGVGRYINDLNAVGGQDAVFDAETGTLEPLPVTSAFVAHQHWWSTSVRTTLSFGAVWVDNLDIQPSSALRSTRRASFALAWSPIQRIDVTSELLWGRRTNKDGENGTAVQLQLGGIFRF